ncbi:translin [Lingula anatina]|uniref:Translin n=1 Tax=Lingula anatina TaxID=7574 RepID=A0A1S3J4P8_LINAN|nr:translin [Lingula anatina]|eukprot:XP_013405360.1 translin [Lingula anatina]
MTENKSPQDIFSSFQDYITKEQDMREEIRVLVRTLEQSAREVLTVLQSVHQPEGIKHVSDVCAKSRAMFPVIRQQLADLAAKIPKDEYYRYHDHWRFVSQRLVFIIAYIHYLEQETLVTREEVASIIQVKVIRGEGFHIDLDDFLMGLLQLASELSRLAVNSVTAGDYGRPMRIAKFVGELDSGFRLLNLKNDSLRKRFDALKYDLKKVEEVVYDVTIRGLRPVEDKDQAKGEGQT